MLHIYFTYSGIISQVEKRITEDPTVAVRPEQTESSKLQKLIVENAHSSYVKHGDLTPFEVLIKVEAEVEKATKAMLIERVGSDRQILRVSLLLFSN